METDETVYGTHEDSHVMSERVQSLAASIYKEFERMIKKYDEDVVKELMPLVVGILESMDQAYEEKRENEVELELLRDDNEQLLTQYEREKQLRKGAEQKYLEVEDANEEEKKDLEGKVESLESIVRMFELKAKNAQDHITRLEDKESEMKKEYTKLHERYTELFKTHMDYMERTKLVMGGDRIMELGSLPKGKMGGFQLPNLKAVNMGYYGGDTPTKPGQSPPTLGITSPRSIDSSTSSLRTELREQDGMAISKEMKDSVNKSLDTADKSQGTDTIEVRERNVGTTKGTDSVDSAGKSPADSSAASPPSAAPPTAVTSPATTVTEQPQKPEAPPQSAEPTHAKEVIPTGAFEKLHRSVYVGDALPPSASDMMVGPDLEDIDDSFGKSNPLSIAGASRNKQNESSIYDELAFHDSEALGEMDDGADITVSDNFFGMGKEVENLILENTELLATKNALNVVKDDLIAKVDELTSEQEILREEITSLQTVKTKLKQRVSELEDELKKMREDLEKAKSAKSGEDGGEEEDIPMAQRKRFTRVEMARVLMERNQYKERLMELQEAVRWTEMIRASREHPELAHQVKKKSSIWGIFSNLMGSSSSSSTSPKKKSSTPTVI